MDDQIADLPLTSSSPLAEGAWHPYLINQEDVVGSVAIALHLASLSEQIKDKPIKEILSDESIFNENSRFSYRLAAEKLTDSYSVKKIRALDQLNKSDDPLFLLIKSELYDSASSFQESISSVDRQIEQIVHSLGFLRQTLLTAASGVVVSVFIFLSIVLTGSVGDVVRNIQGK